MDDEDDDDKMSKSDENKNDDEAALPAENKTFLTETRVSIINTNTSKPLRRSFNHCHDNKDTCFSIPQNLPVRSRSVDSQITEIRPGRVSALVRMTSGLCNVISENADVKTFHKDEAEDGSNDNDLPYELPVVTTKRPFTTISSNRFRQRLSSNGLEW